MTTDGIQQPPVSRIVLAGLCLLVLSAVGCGGEEERLDVVPVRGTLLLRRAGGERVPVPKARLVLHPVENPNAFPTFPAATTGADGSFELGTYARSDGAPEGEYVVTIDARKRARPKRDILGQGERPVGPDMLGGKYSDRNTSQLRVTVVKGQDLVIVVPAP